MLRQRNTPPPSPPRPAQTRGDPLCSLILARTPLAALRLTVSGDTLEIQPEDPRWAGWGMSIHFSAEEWALSRKARNRLMHALCGNTVLHGPSGVPLRPGDFLCAKCGGHNYSRRTACFKCRAPRPAGAPLPPQAAQQAPPAPVALHPAGWPQLGAAPAPAIQPAIQYVQVPAPAPQAPPHPSEKTKKKKAPKAPSPADPPQAGAPEKRRDPDSGRRWTRAQFVERYGRKRGKAAWKRAKQPAAPDAAPPAGERVDPQRNKRQSTPGRRYSYAGFCAYYGKEEGRRRWGEVGTAPAGAGEAKKDEPRPDPDRHPSRRFTREEFDAEYGDEAKKKWRKCGRLLKKMKKKAPSGDGDKGKKPKTKTEKKEKHGAPPGHKALREAKAARAEKER
eukprot:gene1381-19489_t